MKNKKTIPLKNQIIPAFAKSRRVTCAIFFTGALALAAGCALNQTYPETQISGFINGKPFAVHAPKDSNLTGFDASAETNGTIHVHIDSLQCSLNPTNLAAAAQGQTAIVNAIAQAVTQAVQTGGAMALKATQP